MYLSEQNKNLLLFGSSNINHPISIIIIIQYLYYKIEKYSSRKNYDKLFCLNQLLTGFLFCLEICRNKPTYDWDERFTIDESISYARLFIINNMFLLYFQFQFFFFNLKSMCLIFEPKIDMALFLEPKSRWLSIRKRDLIEKTTMI